MAVTFSEVIVDAADPEALAAFWTAVLDWAPTGKYDDGAVEIADRGGCRPTVVFVPSADTKQVKNRIHFDLNPAGEGMAAELDRLLALGARRVDIGQGDQPWAVLADPEGNEFCLLAETAA